MCDMQCRVMAQLQTRCSRADFASADNVPQRALLRLRAVPLANLASCGKLVWYSVAAAVPERCADLELTMFVYAPEPLTQDHLLA